MRIEKKKAILEVQHISSIETYETFKGWQKWLKNQKNFSKNTISSYSYDFKYFLNFVVFHKEKNLIEFTDINNLKIKDFRSWLSFLKYINPI